MVTSPITSTPRLTFTSCALNHFRTVIPRFRPNILSRSSPGQRANKVFHYYCGSRNSTEWNLGHYRLALRAPTKSSHSQARKCLPNTLVICQVNQNHVWTQIVGLVHGTYDIFALPSYVLLNCSPLHSLIYCKLLNLQFDENTNYCSHR